MRVGMSFDDEVAFFFANCEGLLHDLGPRESFLVLFPLEVPGGIFMGKQDSDRFAAVFDYLWLLACF